MGKIMEASVAVEKETSIIIEHYFFPRSDLSSTDVLLGMLYQEFSHLEDDEAIKAESEFTIIESPDVCNNDVLETYEFLRDTNEEYEMSLSFLKFIKRKQHLECSL